MKRAVWSGIKSWVMVFRIDPKGKRGSKKQVF
jgi:hypothetical protein